MRTIVVTEFLSLDGVMENPAWTQPYWNDEVAAFKTEETRASDARLLGRVTYQGFLVEEVNRLKHQAGLDIAVHGSAALAQSLMQQIWSIAIGCWSTRWWWAKASRCFDPASRRP